MVSFESIMSISKSDIQEESKKLNSDDIQQLVQWLSLKNDNIRYQSFLLLQNRSIFSNDVYPYWDSLKDKLNSDNSYQRSIGMMLIAENTKWDTENKIENTIDNCLRLLNDDKPITVRQCIQSLDKIASCEPCLNSKIALRLITFNIMDVKETMRKSTLIDIMNVLIKIRREYRTDEIDSFILNALSGEILDNKLKKQMKALL